MKQVTHMRGQPINELPIQYREGTLRRVRLRDVAEAYGLRVAEESAAEADDVATEDNYVYELAFSSELPVERWFGNEILDHGPKSCDLTRFKAGVGALLWNHDRDQMLGVVDHARIDSDRVGRALVRFGVDEFAKGKQANVDNDTLRAVSFGYRVLEMVLEKTEQEIDTYRVMRWEPFEISLVSVPADYTVGVNRSASGNEATFPVNFIKSEPRMPDVQVTDNAAGTQARDQNTGGADQRYRNDVDSILALASRHSTIIKQSDVQDAVRGGADVTKFQELIISRLATGATDVTGKAIGMSQREVQRYSLLRAVKAQIPGQSVDCGFEREVSTALARALGRDPEGIFVPPEFFTGQRDFTVGTSSEAGNLVQTDVAGELFTDVLRPALVLGQLGVTILSGLSSNLAIPRKTVAGTLGAVTEVAALTETQPTSALVTLSPKRIGAFVEPSKQAIIQGEFGIDAMLRDDLVSGAAVLIENYGINGTASGGQPRGIRNVSGIGSVVGGTNGANLVWSHITGLEAACANVNASSTAKAGYLINTKAVNTAKNTQKATNLQFIWDGGDRPLNDYPVGRSNNVPSNLTKGSSSGVCSSVIHSSDWSMFVLGLFGGMDVTVDPYSLATTGQIRITLNQFIDFACRQPGCFAVMDDALTP